MYMIKEFIRNIYILFCWGVRGNSAIIEPTFTLNGNAGTITEHVKPPGFILCQRTTDAVTPRTHLALLGVNQADRGTSGKRKSGDSERIFAFFLPGY